MVVLTKQKTGASFTAGVAMMTMSALLVKLIGVCYKIPLVNLLGTQGMGYFNAAYDVYALLCVLSTTGLPVAISVVMNQYQGQHKRIYWLSLCASIVIGVLGTGIVFFGADFIAIRIGAPQAAQSLRFIAPAILFICISGAMRGYYQGKRNMLPSAVSQVIEAAGKLLFGLVFAYIAIRYEQSVATAAACAVLGLSIGTLLCMIYLLICGKPDSVNERRGTTGDILKELLKIAFPVTLGALLSGLSRIIDLALIMRRLQDAGATEQHAVSAYGCYSSMVIPLFNAIPALFSSLAMPLVPHLNHAIIQRNVKQQQDIIGTTFRLSALISIPSALGLGMLSDRILHILFHDSSEISQATVLLIVISIALPASCMITATSAVLQAYKKVWIPMLSTASGCVIKAVLLYIMIPQMGILAAPFSTLICCLWIVCINLFVIAKTAPKFFFLRCWISVLSISVISIGIAAIVKRLMQNYVSSPIVIVLIVVLPAVLIYGIMTYKFGLLRDFDKRKKREKE